MRNRGQGLNLGWKWLSSLREPGLVFFLREVLQLHGLCPSYPPAPYVCRRKKQTKIANVRE